MIDVTATMLPSTVMNERSFAVHIASSAIAAESRNLFTVTCSRRRNSLLFGRVVDLDEITVGHAAYRRVRTSDDLISGLQSVHDLEVLVAGDAHLDRHELCLAVTDQKDSFRFLPRLPGLQFCRRYRRLDRGRRTLPLVGFRLPDDLSVRVIDQ